MGFLLMYRGIQCLYALVYKELPRVDSIYYRAIHVVCLPFKAGNYPSRLCSGVHLTMGGLSTLAHLSAKGGM